jgi:hypothetical protein
METNGQCWRVAGLVGRLAAPLVLSIGTTPADNQHIAKRWTVNSLVPPKRSDPKSSATPWLAIIGGSALLMIALLVLALRLRNPSRGT